MPAYTGSTEQFQFRYWTGPDDERFDVGDSYTFTGENGIAEFHACGEYSVEYYDWDGTTIFDQLTRFYSVDGAFTIGAYPGTSGGFSGWLCNYEGEEMTFQPGDGIDERGNGIIRLYALIDSAPTYTVRFDVAGGSGDIDPVVTNSPIYTVPGYDGTKDGYDFIGWSYDGRIHLEGEAIVRPAAGSVMTLTAQWMVSDDGPDSDGMYTIGYYDVDGTLLAVERHHEDDDVTVLGYTGTGTGFKGWRYDCATALLPGEVFRMGNDDIRFFAAVGPSATPDPEPTPMPAPMPVFPTEDGTVEVVVDDGSGSWLDKNGKTVLIIAVVAAIIAELAVLSVSRRR